MGGYGRGGNGYAGTMPALLAAVALLYHLCQFILLGPTLQDADAADSRGQLGGIGQQFDDRFASDQWKSAITLLQRGVRRASTMISEC